MIVPSWYALSLLAFAAFRTWKLIGEDTILDTPRLWALYRIEKHGSKGARQYAEAMIECPWCAGFWISLAWWGAYELWPHGSLIVATPLVLSALVGILGHFTSDD